MLYNWLLIGDLHLGKFKLDFHIHHDFLQKYVYSQIDENTIVYLSGDQFHENEAISTELLVYLVNVFIPNMRKAKKVYVLVGNHDTTKITEIEKNNNAIFSLLEEFEVMDSARVVDVFGEKVAFIPYNSSVAKLEESIASLEADYAFTHFDIDCLLFDNDKLITNAVSAKSLEKFKRVFNGHIHKSQEVGNLLNLGSPYQMKFSDGKNVCGTYLFNPRENTYSFVENTISPKYKKIEFSKLLKMEELGELENKHLWVTEVEDMAVLDSFLADASFLSLRTNKTETEMDLSGADFEHDDEVAENIVDYLKHVKHIQVGDRILKMTDKKISVLQTLAKNL